MLSLKPFTTNNINDIVNKPLYFFDDDRLNVSNIIHPDDLGFLETMVITIRKLFIMNMTGQDVLNVEI